MYPDLRTFVEALDAAGELVRVAEPVNPVLEIAAIADRVSRTVTAPNPPHLATHRTDPFHHSAGGPALLFENVVGSSMPVLINAFGSYRRMEMALGLEDGLEGLAARLDQLTKPKPPRSLAEGIELARELLPMLRIGPKRMRGARRTGGTGGGCQEIVDRGDEIDLTRFPFLRCWPLDGDFAAVGSPPYPADINSHVPGMGHPSIDAARWEAEFRGRYITLAGIHTIHADDRDASKPASHNIGMYRVQLLGKNRMAMHWHLHHDGARHWRSWKKLGEPMPVAIVLGGSSVLPYAATAPLPPGISELLMAGFLGGTGVRMVRGSSVPLWVPADAEMVIEGYASTQAGEIGWVPGATDEPLGPGAVFEGPFGDHTGFYSMPDRYPVVEVTSVSRRRDAIYPTTVVGSPPQEDYFLGKTTERMFLPMLRVLIPDIEDYDLPMFGAFHNCAHLLIDKQYPLHARKVMHAVWGAGQMAWTKTIFVVDQGEGGVSGGVDVHDCAAVLGAAARWCDPARDIERVRGPLDILDHAAPRLGAGTKLGFDCTPKWPGEEAGSAVAISPGLRQWVEGTIAEHYIQSVEAVSGVVQAALSERAPGWLLVSAEHSEQPGFGRTVRDRVLEVECESPPPFIIVVGAHTDLADVDRVLFEWMAHCDAGRDAAIVDHPSGGKMGFDATPKTPDDGTDAQPVRAWPPAMEHHVRTRERLDELWPKLGITPASTGHS